jgi:hypothetical protein
MLSYWHVNVKILPRYGNHSYSSQGEKELRRAAKQFFVSSLFKMSVNVSVRKTVLVGIWSL